MADDEARRRRKALIDSARQRTLKEFEAAVAKGERNPVEELAEYRRRRRDYATWNRMGEAAPEATELARRLAAQIDPMTEKEMEEFCRDVNAMLINLYEEFIIRAG